MVWNHIFCRNTTGAIRLVLRFMKKCGRKTTATTKSTPTTETTATVVALRAAKETTRQTTADREV